MRGDCERGRKICPNVREMSEFAKVWLKITYIKTIRRDNYMSEQKWAMIIIGAGMTGLSTGLTWALNVDTKEKPVLIIDKEPRTGGYVTTYQRKGYSFETCQVIGNLNDVFDYFGVKIELKQFKGDYMRIFWVNPETDEVKQIDIPSGRETFKNWLKEKYSDEADKIEKFMNHSYEMYLELSKLKYDPNFFEILKMFFTCPKIVGNASKSFQEYFDGFGIENPEIKEIFSAFAALSGVPESGVAALLPLGVMYSLLDGAYRPKKGFADLSKQMSNRFEELGGEFMLGKKVEKILVEDGVAKGIQLESGEKLYSDYVITTVDVKLAMKEMVGLDKIRKLDQKYAQKVEDVIMSPSSMNISLGLDDELDLAGMGFDSGYNIITTGGETFDKLFEAFLEGKSGFTDKNFHLGVICPSLTTGTKPALTIRVVPLPKGNWVELRNEDYEKYKAEKERWADFFIDLVEKYAVPELKKHILVKDISTPATYSRYSGSPSASIYSMASFADNFGRKRLKMKTPIKGLYQPKFTHGVFGTITGGLQVIDMILNRKVMNGNSRLKR